MEERRKEGIVVKYNGKHYFSTEAVRELIDSEPNERKRAEIKKIISLRNLTDILTTAGMIRLSNKIDAIATAYETLVDHEYYSSSTEMRQIRKKNEKIYKRKLGRKFSFIGNATQVIGNLISQTLDPEVLKEITGYASRTNAGVYVNSYVLTEDECKKIAKNFKRLARGKDIIPYTNEKEGKTL